MRAWSRERFLKTMASVGRVVGLVLVDEDLEDGGVGHELGRHDPGGRLVGADLVDLLLAGHAEGDHDPAALLLDQLLGRHGQVLEAGDGAADDGEAGAVARALGQLVERLGAHVVAGEHGVDHADQVHDPFSRQWTRRPAATGVRWSSNRRRAPPIRAIADPIRPARARPGPGRPDLGRARRGRGLARVHPDGGLRRATRPW